MVWRGMHRPAGSRRTSALAQVIGYPAIPDLRPPGPAAPAVVLVGASRRLPSVSWEHPLVAAMQGADPVPGRRRPGGAGGTGKRELRARIRASRAARPAEQRAAAAQGLARSAAAAGLVGLATAGYLPTEVEPDVGPLLALARRVLLPVPLSHRVLAWARDDGTRRADPKLPVQIPGAAPVGMGAAALREQGTQLLLLPALAVGRDGVRLGQGGGYYDRLLGELAELAGAGPRVVAVVYDDELLPAGTVGRETHDMAVLEVLTPSGLVVVGGP